MDSLLVRSPLQLTTRLAAEVVRDRARAEASLAAAEAESAKVLEEEEVAVEDSRRVGPQ